MAAMPALTRAAGVRGLLIYCSDYKCSHWTTMSADRWPDDVRLSDIEPRFTCQVPQSAASLFYYDVWCLLQLISRDGRIVG
jgi:hypothetical protein